MVSCPRWPNRLQKPFSILDSLLIDIMVTKKATFGAGCFWGVEEAFSRLSGVSTQVGYMGGTKESPTYRDVCNGKTGHTEVVEVT